jgi:thiamine-monophosphate kinase
VATEFDLIARYFTRALPGAVTGVEAGVVLGVGDDAALVNPRAGHELAITTDLLVAGTHFFPDTSPADLGWKTLAVNVSDIAAMGASPRWATLGLALPAHIAADEAWLSAFADGFFACADAYDIELVGGDTTRGPLAFSVTLIGEAPAGRAVRRSGAQVGDAIWVSGTPGRAALGLAHLQGRIALTEPDLTQCLAALHRPQPRLALGLALREFATAAIDISDGLLADLGHILARSGCGAALTVPDIAVLPALTFAQSLADASLVQACSLSGGDDYELLFTTPPDCRPTCEGLPLTRLGTITAQAGLIVRDAHGARITPTRFGYDHFG